MLNDYEGNNIDNFISIIRFRKRNVLLKGEKKISWQSKTRYPGIFINDQIILLFRVRKTVS